MTFPIRLRSSRLRSSIPLLLVAALSLWAGACAAKKDALPPGAVEPDKFLYEKGVESLDKRRWLTAREYFRRILDTYPQSNYRPDAKLGVGDSYLGEGTTESLILAVNEYREFLTFYPTSQRADYAQLKVGMTHYKQMRKPQRDQSETREAIKEFQTFVERYPNSSLMPEGQQKLRESRDRLSTHEYEVGVFYYKQRWYPGSIDRLKALLKENPGFTRRDGAYYYLAESLMKVKLVAEALPYYEKLLAEFQTSEYLELAKTRRDELRAQLDLKPVAPPAPTSTSQQLPASQSPPKLP
jgi:outer membrane protein assembly factor BamD